MVMAKAIAALVGAIVTALIAAGDVIPMNDQVETVLTIVSIIATAIVTYAVPNRSAPVVQ